MHALLLPEDELGHPGGEEDAADDVGPARLREPLDGHERLAQGEEEAGHREPQPEDRAVQAEQRPEGHVRYVRPVEDLEVTLPPAMMRD